jgi:hypothetical protein
MKVLWIHQYKDIFYTLPQEKTAELNAAVQAFSNKYMKAGKLKDIYVLYDRRIIGLWDFDSDEEMGVAAFEYPLAPYQRTEMVHYADYNTAVALTRKAAAAQQPAKKAKKK